MLRLTTGPSPLIAVLLLATLLRVWGLTWGLPSATHYFSYHPDESRVLQVAMFSISLFSGKLLPHFYNYGTLQLYFVNLANTLAFVFGAVDIVPKDLAVWYPQWARMYLIGRGLTVTMGVGTVWAVYALGRRLWDRRTGLGAALILAIMPLHAQHSHWLTVDVPATFWGTLSLLWTAKLLPCTADDEKSPRPLAAVLWAGLFAGLAAATKYNMALVLLPLAAVCATHSGTKTRVPGRFTLFAVGLGISVIAFLFACPGAVFESSRFLADVRFEAVHVNNAEDPTFKATGNGFVFNLTHNLAAGLGMPLLLLSLVSVGYAVWRRERGDGLLAAFALPYFFVISLVAVRYARYVIPLLPILAVWSGRLVAALTRQEIFHRADFERQLTGVFSMLCGLILLMTVLWTVVLLRPMSQTDNRDAALTILNAHVPADAVVAFPTQPWFGTVPVSPYFPAPQPGAWRRLTSPTLTQRIAYKGRDWDTPALNTTQPAFVIVSEYDTRDVFRLHNPSASAYFQTLDRDYRVLTDVGGRASREQHRLLGQSLPHDMLYTDPEITLYRRKQ